MLNFEKKYRTELFNASFRMYYYDSQYALNVERALLHQSNIHKI